MKTQTLETQSSMTPAIALQYLKEGNARFVNEQMIEKGKIAIIGGKHDLDSGAVEFYADTLLSSQSDMQRQLGA
jgi:hypothetical protein